MQIIKISMNKKITVFICFLYYFIKKRKYIYLSEITVVLFVVLESNIVLTLKNTKTF